MLTVVKLNKIVNTYDFISHTKGRKQEKYFNNVCGNMYLKY